MTPARHLLAALLVAAHPGAVIAQNSPPPLDPPNSPALPHPPLLPPPPGSFPHEPPRRDRPANHPQQLRPFLGVVTVPVSPALGAQLGLAEAFGVVVLDVVPESPAARAGVLRQDVLQLLTGQRLVDPGQLAALVRSAGKDAQVELTLIRGGEELKVTVQLEERLMPEQHPLPPPRRDFHINVERFGDSIKEQAREISDYLRAFQERALDLQERVEAWGKNGAIGHAPEAPKFDFELLHKGMPPLLPKDVIREARPGGGPHVTKEIAGGTRTSNTADARVTMKDESGELELRAENGKRTLTAKSPTGETIFSGPVDTAEQRERVPKELREKMKGLKLETRIEGSRSEARAEAGPPSGLGGLPVLPVQPSGGDIQ